MKPQIEIVIILDRSGSMGQIQSDMEQALNGFVKKQRELPGEARITFVRFDDKYEMVFDNKPICCAEDLKLEPRGTTALLDAVGKTIDDVGARLSATKEQDRPEKVMVVIITDGLENASRKFSRKEIFDKITNQRDNYQWQFVFLGANQDAIAAGAEIGTRTADTMTYKASPQGVCGMSCSLSTYATNFRAGNFAAFTQDDRDKANGK